MAPTGFETGCNSSRGADPTSGTSLSRHGSLTAALSPSSYLSFSPVATAADATDSYSDTGPFYGMFDRCDSDSEDWSNIRLSSPRLGEPRSSMGSLTSSGLAGASETFHKVMQQLDSVKKLPSEAAAAPKEKKDAATSTTRPLGASTRSCQAASATCCTKCGGTKPTSTSVATSTTTMTSSKESAKKPTASSAKAASSASPSSPASASSSPISSISGKANPAGTKERKSSKPVQKSASFSACTPASSGTAPPPSGGAKPPCCPRCCPPQQQQRSESGKRRMSVPACMRSSKHVQWADEAGVSSLVSVRLIRPRLSKSEDVPQAAGLAGSPRSILRRLTGSVH